MKYEKIKEFINDDDNGLVVRLAMVILGIVLGTLLVLFSLIFERGSVGAITFLVFGCVTFAGLSLAAAIWYGNEY